MQRHAVCVSAKASQSLILLMMKKLFIKVKMLPVSTIIGNRKKNSNGPRIFLRHASQKLVGDAWALRLVKHGFSQKVAAYYVSGFALWMVVHLVMGSDTRMLMPRSFLVIILLALAALPWFFINLFNLAYASKRQGNFVDLVTHVLFLTVIILLTRAW